MNRRIAFDRFQFDQQATLYDKVSAKCDINEDIAVFKWNGNLPFHS